MWLGARIEAELSDPTITHTHTRKSLTCLPASQCFSRRAGFAACVASYQLSAWVNKGRAKHSRDDLTRSETMLHLCPTLALESPTKQAAAQERCPETSKERAEGAPQTANEYERQQRILVEEARGGGLCTIFRFLVDMHGWLSDMTARQRGSSAVRW